MTYPVISVNQFFYPVIYCFKQIRDTDTSKFTFPIPSRSYNGTISMKENLLLKAVSRASTLRSAVFIVPTIYKFEGTENSSLPIG